MLTDQNADIDALLDAANAQIQASWTRAEPRPPSGPGSAGLTAAPRQRAPRTGAGTHRPPTRDATIGCHGNITRGGPPRPTDARDPDRSAASGDPREPEHPRFLLPFLVIFGLFAWFPILRAVLMSVQDTNFVERPTFVGLENSRASWPTRVRDRHPATPPGSRRWPWSSASRCRSSWPCSSARSGAAGALQRASLPAGRRTARRVRAALEVLLRGVARRGVFNTILGWVGLGPVPWLQRRGHGHAVDRHRGDLGGRRRHGHHLPRRPRSACGRSCRRGRGRRRLDLAEDPLHHAAAAAQRAARDADPAAHRARPSCSPSRSCSPAAAPRTRP